MLALCETGAKGNLREWLGIHLDFSQTGKARGMNCPLSLVQLGNCRCLAWPLMIVSNRSAVSFSLLGLVLPDLARYSFQNRENSSANRLRFAHPYQHALVKSQVVGGDLVAVEGGVIFLHPLKFITQLVFDTSKKLIILILGSPASARASLMRSRSLRVLILQRG